MEKYTKLEAANRPSSAEKKVAFAELMAENIIHFQMNKSKSLKEHHVSVKSFPGATARFMKHYIKTTLEESQPDKIL